MSTLLIKEIPPDLKDFILDLQLELKKKKKSGTYSQDATVLHIIREYKKLIGK